MVVNAVKLTALSLAEAPYGVNRRVVSGREGKGEGYDREAGSGKREMYDRGVATEASFGDPPERTSAGQRGAWTRPG
jgi:hypothetical protein